MSRPPSEAQQEPSGEVGRVASASPAAIARAVQAEAVAVPHQVFGRITELARNAAALAAATTDSAVWRVDHPVMAAGGRDVGRLDGACFTHVFSHFHGFARRFHGREKRLAEVRPDSKLAAFRERGSKPFAVQPASAYDHGGGIRPCALEEMTRNRRMSLAATRPGRAAAGAGEFLATVPLDGPPVRSPGPAHTRF